MYISENKYGEIFHRYMYIKYNKLYNIFRNIYIYSPILILFYYITYNIWVFPIVILIILISWILSVKMRSLRNINYHAYNNFKNLNLKEIFK